VLEEFERVNKTLARLLAYRSSAADDFRRLFTEESVLAPVSAFRF